MARAALCRTCGHHAALHDIGGCIKCDCRHWKSPTGQEMENEGHGELDLRSYLEHAIVYWRSIQKTEATSIRKLRAAHYIDAYQSVYASMFGETYPLNPSPEPSNEED